MDDKQFLSFLSLLMCSDPWPVQNDEDGYHNMISLANAEAERRGYKDWIDAYHSFRIDEFKNKQSENVEVKLTVNLVTDMATIGCIYQHMIHKNILAKCFPSLTLEVFPVRISHADNPSSHCKTYEIDMHGRNMKFEEK